ncbi:hypothetical protein [Eggerthella sinensis]|uniref:hypothetical protein n=1 Tax=Eggerthella sinensis TaxID=242230 RepID=UPI0022DF2704|nr:hypothetical protein [Eggerthella sinensis]
MMRLSRRSWLSYWTVNVFLLLMEYPFSTAGSSLPYTPWARRNSSSSYHSK